MTISQQIDLLLNGLTSGGNAREMKTNGQWEKNIES